MDDATICVEGGAKEEKEKHQHNNQMKTRYQKPDYQEAYRNTENDQLINCTTERNWKMLSYRIVKNNRINLHLHLHKPIVTQHTTPYLHLPHLEPIWPLVKCNETSSVGGWVVATNFNVSSRQRVKF